MQFESAAKVRICHWQCDKFHCEEHHADGHDQISPNLRWPWHGDSTQADNASLQYIHRLAMTGKSKDSTSSTIGLEWSWPFLEQSFPHITKPFSRWPQDALGCRALRIQHWLKNPWALPYQAKLRHLAAQFAWSSARKLHRNGWLEKDNIAL